MQGSLCWWRWQECPRGDPTPALNADISQNHPLVLNCSRDRLRGAGKLSRELSNKLPTLVIGSTEDQVDASTQNPPSSSSEAAPTWTSLGSDLCSVQVCQARLTPPLASGVGMCSHAKHCVLLDSGWFKKEACDPTKPISISHPLNWSAQKQTRHPECFRERWAQLSFH